MPLTPVTMHVLTCDACSEPFDDDEGGTLFPDATAANTAARTSGWTVLGDEYLCHLRDDAHQAFIDRAMPPEPVTQVPGQLDLNLDGNPRIVWPDDDA